MAWTNLPPGRPDCATSLQHELAQIKRITDGDTVVLSDNRRVRLIGINTPELNEPHKALRTAAQRAHDALKELLPVDEPVLLYIGSESHDRHNRVLAHVVRQSDQLFVATSLLQQGHALHVAVSPNTRCANYFSILENNAREQKLGVWQLSPLWSKQAKSITSKTRGFQLISGTVTNIQSGSRTTRLTLDNQLSVQVRKVLASELKKNQDLEKLLGIKVEVRGWLNRRKNRTTLHLHHPSNLRVLAD